MPTGTKFFLIETLKTSHPGRLPSLLNVPCSIKVVDIGANAIDCKPPYARMLEGGYANVVGFEPNREALAKLNAAKSDRESYLPHAIGDGRRRILRHCLAQGMSSLLEPNVAILSLFPYFSEWGTVVGTEDVETVRLDDVPETASPDMLKIDIQGAELMVFENAVERLKTALVVHTEVEFLPMYIGQPLFSEVERFLRAQGFVLHKFDPLVGRDFQPLISSRDPYTGHSQLFWADAIFVRDFTRLERLDAEQLLRLAVILHDCYGSFDLALFLLREHDRRTAQGLGEKYFRAIVSLADASSV